METNNLEVSLKLDFYLELWKDFCETHTRLYDFTCEEYMHLMASEIDDLSKTVEQKLELLELVNQLDNKRQELSGEIYDLLGVKEPVTKLEFFLKTIRQNNFNEKADQIEKLNAILIDIIEKIQEQNKKNQLFLNKAIHSLQELREGFVGKTSYKTYSANGQAKSGNTL